ncbi:MAG TPA: PCRF domain-containing protein, partial [Candidatus Acidoferrales bacterium]|nr:PCRF domain-containing protein [Candidatus Acidoferrales bacterium]
MKALEAKASDPAFWQDQEKAQGILQQRKHAEGNIAADEKLTRAVSDIETYFHMAHEESDAAQRESVLKDVSAELDSIDKYIGELETQTLLSGENDALSAIMTIKPGAGGTESQDWAEMLMRMYLRWTESKNLRATVIDSTPGE